MFLSPELLGVTSHATVWQMAVLSFVSFAVGILGGFVGLALGIMRLPALLLLGFPVPLAAGTNIMVSTLSAVTGSVTHIRQGRINWRVVGTMGIPSVIGALLGGLFSDRAPEALLIALVGAFVTWQGVELTLRTQRHQSQGDSAPAEARLAIGHTPVEASTGLGVGLLGGAVGLILGSLRLPIMVRILGMNLRMAAGTNLVIGSLLGTFGFIGHGIRGNVDIPVLALMGITGMVGSYYGARLTGRVRLSTLNLVMGLVLLVVGPLLLANAFQEIT